MNTLYALANTRPQSGVRSKKGFTLIITLGLVVLLVTMAVGLLKLSSVSLRRAAQLEYQARAQANARLALQLAIAELQAQMGPDQRISAKSSILDATQNSTSIENVAHPHWLGAWDSWSGWLNHTANAPNGSSVTISDTYNRGRNPMFRRWLVSLPNETTANTLDTAITDSIADRSIRLVDKGTSNNESDYVSAYLMPVSNAALTSLGSFGWWVSGQNQKADASANQTASNLTAAELEQSSGNSQLRHLNQISNFENLSQDATTLEKLLDYPQIQLANVPAEGLKTAFHDVTVAAPGLIADVRWGGLKKDLNLLFEQNPTLPTELARNTNLAPSPRPMSADITANAPKITNRPFSSYEMMQLYYRMYKPGSITPITWNGTNPRSDEYYSNSTKNRSLVFAKQYMIYSLMSRRINSQGPGLTVGNYNLYLTHTSVIVLWNPYNIPMVIPDKSYSVTTKAYKALPTSFRIWKNGSPTNTKYTNSIATQYDDFGYTLTSGNGSPIRFEPGQFRVFSITSWPKKNTLGLVSPGYNPYISNPDPGILMGQLTNIPPTGVTVGCEVRFEPTWLQSGSAWWFGVNPGGCCMLNQIGIRHHGFLCDWTASDYDYAPLTSNQWNDMPKWQLGITQSIPFAVAGMTIKSGAKLDYNQLSSTMPDYRGKNWIQGLASAPLQKMQVSYTNPVLAQLQRKDNPFQLHFTSVASNADLAMLLSSDANNVTTLGNGVNGEQVNRVAVEELPTAPITSIAGFAGMQLRPGWFKLPSNISSQASRNAQSNAFSLINHSLAGYQAGVPSVGIGNSFAQPMINGEKIYHYHDVSKSTPASRSPIGDGPALYPSQDILVLSDYWDHGLLMNDGLWDSWYTSSFCETTRPTQPSGTNVANMMKSFYMNGTKLPDPNYQPWLSSLSPDGVVSKLSATDGYLKASSHMINKTAFNVNSTSVNAWYALFAGLKNNAVTYRDPSGAIQKVTPPSDHIALSRFITAIGNTEANNPLTPTDKTWTGIRFINNQQLLKLAEQCVFQVKQRGPFLNMSDFINRRLVNSELGTKGALQAAIDYDDASPDANSINYNYKISSGGIASPILPPDSRFPNPLASNGSVFTGAPGYVIQSDVLRPLGNSLTVRDDCFLIRTYGEAKNKEGKVVAKAYCEARIQRCPEYVDSTVSAETPRYKVDTNGAITDNASALGTINTKFGRKLKIISFRWLQNNEI
jgi:hypothetical protein